MTHAEAQPSPVLAEHINRLNKIKVLNLIRQEKEISRADIVKKTGLSAPTVTRITDSLINKEKLVIQTGIGESSGGRPPVMVRFNGEDNYVIGLDWGRTHLNGIVADLNGHTILNLDIPVNAEIDPELTTDSVFTLINRLMAESGISRTKILGIGLAVAGFVNKYNHEIEFSPNFGWKRVNLQNIIQDQFDIPVLMENVSRVMSLGELCYGVGQSLNHFLFINIGYGIGAGLIIDGKPYLGFDGFAGEIGHTHVTPPASDNTGSRTCVCGKQNCLESFASGRGIAQTVKEGIDKQEDSILFSMSGDKKNITTERIAKAADQGDRYARQVMEEAADILGTSLASISNVMNPEAIVIGGKVALSGDYFLNRIKSSFYRETLPNTSRPVAVYVSSLLGHAAVKGAVALILKEVLDLNVNK